MRLLFNFLFLAALFFGADFALADEPPANPPVTETAEQRLAAALKREEDLKKENEELKKKANPPKDPPKDDEDLAAKAAKERENAEKQGRETKRIENALQFNLGIDDFVKKNSDLLPKSVSDIIRVAHKETYDTAVAKANAVKASVIQEYFQVESNLEALTSTQKEKLDDYLKLTKTGKEDKAAEIYADIFEPALETIRKIKKAEEIGRTRGGYSDLSDSDSAYKDKLIKGSQAKYIGA